MERKQTMVQLSDTLLDVLDRRAAATGRSRSELIREAVEQYFKDDVEALIDAQIIEGYTRIPDDGEFDALAEEGLRLTMEEDPW
ncbi:MAG TPA: CopG family transcriptional regulator [Actinomycetes bacterium]|jgi:metal-responsive CopG/Arc/MetJ family transcriptional regulator|nr:CopG family transcriptional regulator [Actinomycetes bacterium]